jgi:hypothetical protein
MIGEKMGDSSSAKQKLRRAKQYAKERFISDPKYRILPSDDTPISFIMTSKIDTRYVIITPGSLTAKEKDTAQNIPHPSICTIESWIWDDKKRRFIIEIL